MGRSYRRGPLGALQVFHRFPRESGAETSHSLIGRLKPGSKPHCACSDGLTFSKELKINLSGRRGARSLQHRRTPAEFSSPSPRGGPASSCREAPQLHPNFSTSVAEGKAAENDEQFKAERGKSSAEWGRQAAHMEQNLQQHRCVGGEGQSVSFNTRYM